MYKTGVFGTRKSAPKGKEVTRDNAELEFEFQCLLDELILKKEQALKEELSIYGIPLKSNVPMYLDHHRSRLAIKSLAAQLSASVTGKKTHSPKMTIPTDPGEEDKRTRILRPLYFMDLVNKRYPTACETADMFRAGRGIDYPSWSEWCFLPHGAWYAYVGVKNADAKFANHALIRDISVLAAIVPWSLTQGIYCFDSDLISSLDRETFRQHLPVASFKKLPEWSVYVDSQNLSWFGEKLNGFWVSLEEDANSGETELRFLLALEKTGLRPQVVHLGEWSLAEGVNKTFRFSDEAGKKRLNLPAEMYNSMIDAICVELRPLVAIVLYLCSDDYLTSRGLLEKRLRPKAENTKLGLKHRPAEKPTVYNLHKGSAKVSGAPTVIDPQAIIRHCFSSTPNALVNGKAYHSPLPAAIRDWYCYIIDSGHSVFVIPKCIAETAFSGEIAPYMLCAPASVKDVLQRGYEIRDGYVISDVKYDYDFGLISEEVEF
ncbi:MAG: hypothetical protein PHH28_08945 [Desulfuromonadaceae bacterium]|nr:hypothetical protein [Desulfuromonadaceae bacterium]